MGKRAPKPPPPPPDPWATARAQGEMNIETARTNAALNRINQVDPFGRITYRDLGREYADREVQHHINAYRRGEWYDPNFIRNGNIDANLLRQHFMRPEHNPYLDRWEMRTELSPEQQELYQLSTDAQRQYGQAALRQLQSVQNLLASPFEFNGPALQANLRDRTGNLQYDVRDLTGEVKRRADFTGIGDPNQAREDVQAALLARLNPQLERERAALEAQLANQGISAGSEAWRAGFDDYNRMANDARLAAILNAGQEQSRMWQLGLAQSAFNNEALQQIMTNDLARGQFTNSAVAQAAQMDLARAAQQNAARQQAFQEALAMRVQLLNETAALLSGEQVRIPTLAPVPQVGLQPPDYQGAVAANYAGQIAAHNARTQMIGAQNAALGNLLGTLGGAWIFGMRR